MTAIQRLPLSAIKVDRRVSPRSELDQQRVAEFVDLYEEAGTAALPPLEVIVDHDGESLLYDGHHRLEALREFGDSELEVPVYMVETAKGRDTVELAFERAVAVSSTSAKPLTRRERRVAVMRLLRSDVSRSDREIARIAGMSPTTVGKIRRELAAPASGEPDVEAEAGDWYVATVTAKELARRAFRALERVRETRGLGVADRLLGDRTSERFARVLTNEFGEVPSNAQRNTGPGSTVRSST